MRTNIDLDDALVREAMAFTGARTKRDVVHKGLRVLLQRHRQVEALESIRGLGWDGDLEAMRLD